MKSTIAPLALALALTGAGAVRLAAQTNLLKIYTAIEVEFQTEFGKTYTLQGAVGLTNWTDIGNPVLGNGQVENRIFSTKNGVAVSYAAYRLQIGPGPTNGYAPWSIAGVSLQMDDQSASNVVQYLSSTNGQDHYGGGDDPFSYHYDRLSEGDGRTERTYSPERHDTITYTFNGPGAGTWVREEYQQGVLKGRHVGEFHYLAYGTNTPAGTNPPPVITPVQPPAPPNLLTGLIYYVFTGPIPDKYQFNSTNSGVATPGQPSSGRHSDVSPGGNVFAYNYTVLSSNTASLNVNFGYYGIGGDRQEYDLTFTDGPNGLFNRRIYRLGSLYVTDHGVFSPNAALPVPGGTNNSPAYTNAPPANPAGLTYTMNVGETSRLVFQSASSGIEFDDSAPSSFSYTYVATGTNTFSLKAQFKPDKWDEYDLTFSSGAGGTMVRREYKSNALNRTDAGTFNVAVTTN